MFKIIKHWIWEHIWRRRIVPNKYDMTAKGECLIQYLLDRYINESKPNEYIEVYDKELQDKVAEWREKGKIETWFSQFDNIDDYTDTDLKYFAAMNYFTILISITKKEKRTKYYDQIENEDLKAMVIKMVEGR